MTNIFTIIDPINYKKYIINTNEIKNWVDVASLKYLLTNNKQAKDAFNRMQAEEKEAVFAFIDRHEEETCFNPKKWSGINGVNLDLDFTLEYDSSSIYFFDEINTKAKDRAFFSKEIYTISKEGQITLGETVFPVKTMWAFSDDFIKTEDLEDEDLNIFFRGYFGDETDSSTKVIINQQSQATPIHFSNIFKKEECWLYHLNITFVNEINLPNIMWYGVPSIKKLYDFFFENNFKVINKNTKITEWHRNEDIIQYFHTPEHFYEPFLLVKQFKGNKDVSSRNRLGTSIFNAMQRSGLLEDIYLYKGNNYLNHALDSLGTTNKMNADNWLTDAIDTFKLCENHNQFEANANSILCKWLKNRIGNLAKNQTYEDENSKQILLHLLKYRNWDEILKFLLFLSNLNPKHKLNFEIVKNLFPVYNLELEYFLKPETITNITTIWDEEMSKNIPETIPELIEIIPIADKMNATKTIQSYLKTLFRYAKQEDNYFNFPQLINDDFFNICLKYNFAKDYIQLCDKVIPFFNFTKNNLNFGDLSYSGRKEYRWKSFVCCMGEYKFLFHKAYILQQINHKKQEDIFNCFNDAIEVFQDGMVFLDLSENYTEEQLSFIVENCLSLYNVGIITKNDEIINSVIDFLEQVWDKFKSFFLYQKICMIFPNRTRDAFAMTVCNSWKKVYGSEFYEKKEILPDLIFLYITTEQWDAVMDSFEFALNTYSWDFESFEHLYSLYKKTYEFTTIEIPEKVINRINEIINIFIEETAYSQDCITPIMEKIYKILKV